MPWLAAQDGSGPWQPLSGTTFPVTDSSGRYGVAWVCAPSGGEPAVSIVQATVGESSTVTASCQVPAPPGSPYTISGPLSGIPAGGMGVIAIKDESTNVNPPSGQFLLNAYPQYKNNLVAYGLDANGKPGNLVLQRNLHFSGNTTTYNVDLSSGQPFTLRSLDIANVPSGEQPQGIAFLASTGTELLLAHANASTTSFPEIPPSLAQSGDSYVLVGVARVKNGNSSVGQSVTRTMASPGATNTVTLPAALPSGAGLGVVGGNIVANWGAVSFANSSGFTVFDASLTPTSGTAPAATVMATKGWLGSSTSYSFPDLSSTAGWDAGWDFVSGQTDAGVVFAAHTSLTLPQYQAYEMLGDLSALTDGTIVEKTSQYTIGTY